MRLSISPQEDRSAHSLPERLFYYLSRLHAQLWSKNLKSQNSGKSQFPKFRKSQNSGTNRINFTPDEINSTTQF